MKIIRWLLSNVFLILVVVAVIYGYMFWGNLLGEKTPAGKALAYLSHEFVEVEEFINAVKAKQATLSSNKEESAAVTEPVNTEPTDTEVTAVAADVEADSVSSTVENVTAESVPVAVTNNERSQPAAVVTAAKVKPPMPIQQGQTAENKAQSTGLTAVEPARSDVSEEKFVSAEVEQQLENVDEQGIVIDGTLQKEMVRSNWITARKSFFQRKYELSEQSYQKVIDNTTDNYDAYGELGNVYFNQGKKQQAASAYYQAATILVRKGEAARARSLMGLLRQLDSEKAKQLQVLMDSGAS